METEMKGELGSVIGLLDKLKEDRKKDIMSKQDEKDSRLEKLKEARRLAGKDQTGDERRELFYPKQKPDEAKVLDFSAEPPSDVSSPVPARPPAPASYEPPPITRTFELESSSESRMRTSEGDSSQSRFQTREYESEFSEYRFRSRQSEDVVMETKTRAQESEPDTTTGFHAPQAEEDHVSEFRFRSEARTRPRPEPGFSETRSRARPEPDFTEVRTRSPDQDIPDARTRTRTPERKTSEGEARKKSVTVTVNMSQSERRRKESRESLRRDSRDDARDEDLSGETGEYRAVIAQKRKQDDIVSEIHEKAEIISKSARKGPDMVASSIAHVRDLEEDPEAAEYLRKIRETSFAERRKDKTPQDDFAVEDAIEKKDENYVETSAPQDVGSSKTVSVKLNLDLQKSRISAAKGKGIKGRRKPTSEHRRSWRLSNDDDLDEKYAEWERENIDQDEADGPVDATEYQGETPVSTMACTAVSASVMEDSPVEYPKHLTSLPRRGSFDGLIPRTTPKPPKPKWKSKTYGGIALPAFDEAVKSGGTKILRRTSTEAMLTADVVRQAAQEKINRALKEDRPEREPEKPDWLIEAETRRKLHDQRRRPGPKTKPPEEPEPEAISVKLRPTGANLLEDDGSRQDVDEEEEKTELAFKLKPTGRRLVDDQPDGARVPEQTEFQVKLRTTGIQLVKPEEEEGHVEKKEDYGVIPVRLRPMQQKDRPQVETPTDEESEVAVKLRLVRERLNAQEEQEKAEQQQQEREEHVKVRIRPQDQPYTMDAPQYLVDGPQKTGMRSDVAPGTAPVKVQTRSEVHAVTLSQKSLESAHVVSPVPTRTKAESTPPLSPTIRSPTATAPTKGSYKVTPWYEEPRYREPAREDRNTQERREREFSPPSRKQSNGEQQRTQSQLAGEDRHGTERRERGYGPPSRKDSYGEHRVQPRPVREDRYATDTRERAYSPPSRKDSYGEHRVQPQQVREDRYGMETRERTFGPPSRKDSYGEHRVQPQQVREDRYATETRERAYGPPSRKDSYGEHRVQPQQVREDRYGMETRERTFGSPSIKDSYGEHRIQPQQVREDRYVSESREPVYSAPRTQPVRENRRYSQERRKESFGTPSREERFAPMTFTIPTSPPPEIEHTRKRSDSIPTTILPRPYQPPSPTKPKDGPQAFKFYTSTSAPASPATSRVTVVSHRIGEPPMSPPIPGRLVEVTLDTRAGPDRSPIRMIQQQSRPARVTHIDGPAASPVQTRVEAEPILQPARVTHVESVPPRPEPARSPPPQKTPEASRPAKIRARHLGSERSKSVTVTARDVSQALPARKASAEYPQFKPIPEYPKMRVEKAGDGYLKHAAMSTVVTAKHIPPTEQRTLVRDVQDGRAQVKDFARPPPGTQSTQEPPLIVRSSREVVESGVDYEDTQISPEGLKRIEELESQRKVVQEVEPEWMRALAERRRRGIIRRFSEEIMSAEEQNQHSPSLPREDEPGSPREKPIFLSEFERKRRHKGPGPQIAQVYDETEWRVRRSRQGVESPGAYRRPGSSTQSYV